MQNRFLGYCRLFLDLNGEAGKILLYDGIRGLVFQVSGWKKSEKKLFLLKGGEYVLGILVTLWWIVASK
jgi:hypothetical protein